MEGILAFNHRSEPFMELMAKTKKTLYDKLDVPKDYKIVFLSSATECWEVIAQSVVKEHSQHFYNGAFGQKWAKYTQKLGKETTQTEFDIQEALPFKKLRPEANTICVTQNKTSN
jgi:phosphoserine aminotransferase